jgi:hypothetical protein
MTARSVVSVAAAIAILSTGLIGSGGVGQSPVGAAVQGGGRIVARRHCWEPVNGLRGQSTMCARL